MFIGHFGFGAKRFAPGTTAVTPLEFQHYPVSHSLVAVVGWAALVGGGYFALRQSKAGAIAWVGQAQWLPVILGFWLDRHRVPREAR